MLNILVIFFGITACARERWRRVTEKGGMVMFAVVCEHSINSNYTMNESTAHV